MSGCKTVATPLITTKKFRKEDGFKKVDGSHYRSLIENQLYLAAIRLDIMYAGESDIKIHARSNSSTLRNRQKNSSIPTRN